MRDLNAKQRVVLSPEGCKGGGKITAGRRRLPERLSNIRRSYGTAVENSPPHKTKDLGVTYSVNRKGELISRRSNLNNCPESKAITFTLGYRKGRGYNCSHNEEGQKMGGRRESPSKTTATFTTEHDVSRWCRKGHEFNHIVQQKKSNPYERGRDWGGRRKRKTSG